MREFVADAKLMGSAFRLALVHDCEKQAGELLRLGIDEIERLERLLSEFLPDSETTRINQIAPQETLKIDQECFELIYRCQAISRLTKGAFDITVGPLKALYQFCNKDFEIPDPETIRETLAAVGFRKLELNPEKVTIRFCQPGMKISFSAIGKGYASDKVKKLWQQNGVTAGYINASGDLNAFGQKPDGSPWKIAVANPDNRNEVLLYVPLNNASVATSGDAEQHFIHQGKRYSHNLDPHSGLPLSGIKSVTVFSPSAELSDALATAVYVKGVKPGLAFVDQLPHTHGIIVDAENLVHFSENLKYAAV